MSTKIYYLEEIHRMSNLPPTLKALLTKICVLYKNCLDESFAIAVMNKKKEI